MIKKKFKFKNIFKNIGYLYASQVVGKLFYLILIVFVSRFLGIVSLGQYASSLAIVEIFFMIGNAGLDALCVREISVQKKAMGRKLSSLIALKFCISCLVFFAAIFVSNTVASLRDIKDIIVLFSIAKFIICLAQTFCCVLIAYEKIKQAAVFFILYDAITVGLSILTFLSGSSSLYHIAVCFMAGGIVCFIFGIWAILNLGITPDFRIDYSLIRGYFSKSLPFSLGAIFLFALLRVDIVIVKLINGNYAAGLYKIAYTFFMNAQIFPVFFMVALYPKFSRLFVKSRQLLVKTYKSAYFYLLWINLAILFLAIAFGKPVILYLFGAQLAESVLILRIGIFAVFFLFQSMINFEFFNSINKPSLSAYILGVGILINIFLDAVFVTIYGYKGVLLAMFASYLFIFLTSTYVINKKIRMMV